MEPGRFSCCLEVGILLAKLGEIPMNNYDLEALRAIQRYHKKYGHYPAYIEATAGYRSKMSMAHFICLSVPEPINVVAVANEAPPTLPDEIGQAIPVVPLGTGDIIFHGIMARNHDINLEQAKCQTQEQFQRLGAKLARAGLLLLEPKQNWGQQNMPPFLFVSQIEVWAFGEQAAFEKVMAEEDNQLPGE